MLPTPSPSLPSLLALTVAALAGFYVGHAPTPGRSFFGDGIKDEATNPRQAIFDELSAAETIAVAKYVTDAMPGVKTSMYPDGGVDGDYISGTSAVELIPPPKAAALAYVDGETDERPPRYARVTVVRGSKLDIMEYRVGPIHGCDANNCDHASVEEGSPIVPLVEEGTLPFEKRPMDLGDATPLALAGEHIFDPLKALLIESFGPVWDDSLMPGCGEACFSGAAGRLYPFAFNDIESSSKARISKIQFFWYAEKSQFQAIWLHGLPFSFRISQVGTDVADWTVYDLFYCGQGPYPSAAALLAANPEKCTYKPDASAEGHKGSWDIPGPDDKHKNRPTPLPTAPPIHATYTLQGTNGGNGRFVQWQGWSFFAALRPSTGLVAMDVRFKGTKVAYELALSEAAAHYSGTGADQVYYLDGAYSMSQLGGDLRPGVDCPTHATYLDAALWVRQHDETNEWIYMDSDVSKTQRYKAFCVFEEPVSGSFWRHLQLPTKAVDGVPASNLVVRAVTAVGNYDYITEYKFNLDGSIRVNFDFAGYMETRWFSQKHTPWERSLGEIVHKNLIAPLHSHFGCFKVDLDMAGGESFEQIKVTAGDPGNVPDLRGHATKYVTRHYPETEMTTAPPATIPTVNAIVSDPKAVQLTDSSTTSPPGYVIKPGPTVAQALPPEHPFVMASAFSKYTLAVTQRKETEPRPTSVYDLYGPGEPVTSLDTFLDGESIVQKDLVVWVNLGKEHVPRTEDVPLISNFGTYFDILPRNVYDGNAAMDVYTAH